MNLANCSSLQVGPESRTWFRAISPHHSPTALQSTHTATTPSRFSDGSGQFEILYFAEDHTTALFEVRAIVGSPFGLNLPNPFQAWTIFNIVVSLQQVADLSRVSQQQLVETSAQELTGDWRGYQVRSRTTSVNQPFGVPAPTQQLGEALFFVPGIEAFRTVSACVPTKRVLGVFPGKLMPASVVEIFDAQGQLVHRLP